MMVASNSIVNSDQSHHRYISTDADDSSPDMSYHMPPFSDGIGFEQDPVFMEQTGTYNSLDESSFLLPKNIDYKEVLQHISRRNVNTRISPDFFPPNKKISVSSAAFEGSNVTRSDGVPLQMNRSEKIKKTRYPSMEINRESSMDIDDPISSIPLCVRRAKTFSRVKDFQNSSKPQTYKKSNIATSPTTEDKEDSENSNTRHSSQSSTHSSSSSTPKSATKNRNSSVTKVPENFKNVPDFFFDDGDDSWKICSVCNDKATGYHFNALTCEGCKGFFRRSMKNSKTFTCPYSGNCTITKSNRRQCQACRLQKCLKIGMKKECIMSRDQIMLKKNLMLNNRIKRTILEWRPMEITPEQKELLDKIHTAHCETNKPPPPPKRLDDIACKEAGNPGASPASVSSQSSGFSDLIDRMTQDIVATAPGQSDASKVHMQHFSDIMEFSIKEIIKFCKKIPTFTSVSLKDQITLLKSGCTEILFIKANYTYDRKEKALMCGPGKYYTRQSFIHGGMSEEYTDCYLKFHSDLSQMELDETELSCMCAATLFSSDRNELESKPLIESQQDEIVTSLQAYSENTYNCRMRFPKIMSFLTRLRTLNWHISNTLQRVKGTEAVDEVVNPLILEVTPTV